MRVTNKYSSHIGLGELRVLPGETVELPKGYDENHPVVKYYLSRGWFVPADSTGERTDSSKSTGSVNVSADIAGGKSVAEKSKKDKEKAAGEISKE